MKNVIYVFIPFMIGCNHLPFFSDKESRQVEANDKILASSSEKIYKTLSGKTISISEEHPIGQSSSDIKITAKDFNFDAYLKDHDPIAHVMLADLDQDGFDEIYIQTTGAGSGSYGTLIGLASDKDKSLMPINGIASISEPASNMSETEKEGYEGYWGHDSFAILNHNLVRRFPVYKKNDTNAEPTGGRRELYYRLEKEAGAWELKIIKWVDTE